MSAGSAGGEARGTHGAVERGVAALDAGADQAGGTAWGAGGQATGGGGGRATGGEGGRAAGADLLQLDRAAAPARGLTVWLAGALRAAIRDGRLRAGTVLPASRVLAEDLGVSRGVVVEAYQRLREEGLISGRSGAGTKVLPTSRSLAAGRPAPGLAAVPDLVDRSGLTAVARLAAGRMTEGFTPVAAGSVSWPPPLSDPAKPPEPLELPRRWLADVELDLSPGVPDLSAFPRAGWLRAERAVLAETSVADLGYGDPRGHEQLRGELAGWLARTRGLRAEPDQIVVTAGVAQALALMSQVLRGRGHRRMAVENPGSRGTRDELAHWGLEPVPVPVDDDGLDVAALAASGTQAAVLTPAHQFPTGVVLSPQRRRELLDWTAAGGLVVEDDYDAEFRYDRTPVPALHGSAPDRIAYAASVSKTLAPGMRLGWLVPPPELYAGIVRAKHASDLGAPALPQLVLARLISTGDLEQHIRQVRHRQRRRRDALLEVLRGQLPDARVQGIPAGLHLLVTFPDRAELDDQQLMAALRRAGVLVHALSWHREQVPGTEPAPPGLVLGYAAHTPDQLREAARRIARVVRDASC
ncbi:MAG: PLP-dependent aminotransferase family protein [Actinobacteria bacterium]|nr:PLP-dependent aminotransferase family protein [Actinomycetota bacterium]